MRLPNTDEWNSSVFGVGTYLYGAQPHAVTSVSLNGTVTATYAYDADGNMTSGAGRTIATSAYDRVTTITQGTATVHLSYDADDNRFYQSTPEGTTNYLNDPFSGVQVEAFEPTGSNVIQWNEYLFAGSERVGVHLSYSNGAAQHTQYFTLDYLNSVAVVADSSGNVIERDSYDAWGKRRFATGADDPTNSITSVVSRGYTGQEHIHDVALINLNARMYDPALARFTAPDPMIGDVYDPQQLNPYSYARNNPLLYTDTSGMCFLGCFWKSPIFRDIVAIAVAVTLNFEVLALETGASFGAVASAAWGGP